ncbi:g3135 [Coccomyxa viridis]|uniref:G3135 protein n=1 Tax=Coccomyxa viridis TaxID=1274662 RepID=A0ABP1FM29_9CHLO
MSGHDGGPYTAAEVNSVDSLNPLLPASWNSERFAKVLQGKIDILSSNGLDAALVPAPSTPGSIKAFNPETDPIVQYVNQQMEQYVKQMKELAEEMQHALQHISDELATEVAREQQHLMLMQDQVDKHKSDASREVHEMQRRVEQEKTQRTCMMRATREALGSFESKEEAQDARIEVLAGRIQTLETQLAERDAPLLVRIVRSFWRFLFGRGRRSSLDGAPDSTRRLSDREPLIDEAAFKTPQHTPARPKQSQPEPAP